MIRQASKGKTDVLLVGFQDQDNLGLRYLISSLNEAGYHAKIVTYQPDPEPLVDIINREEPDIVGFSLIFQYMAPSFAKIIEALRARHISTHLTMGGHFSSFEYEEVLNRIPGLDSVVRFEGERTLVELLQKIKAAEDWHEIEGIAFQSGISVKSTPLRPPVKDLDVLPFPFREDIAYESQEIPTASILGSRGCPWNCSFCSIRPFYEAQGGRLRRLRSPGSVVKEMIDLYEQRNVCVFLFQDDDFLAGGKNARQWAEQIAFGIVKKGYAGKIAFKISCRSDEIHEDNLEKLKAGGLTHIYMGVESGDAQGLINLNKHITPDVHLRAGEIIKSLGISFDFGFMLLEPDSTFESVRNNIDFLETFVGDGSSVATFCRMLPYSGAPVKRKLEREGRLFGSAFDPDYQFLDPRLDFFYRWMLQTFYERNFTNSGLGHILKILSYEANLTLPRYNKFSDQEKAYVRYFISVCNKLAFYTLRTAIDYMEFTPLEAIERDDSFLYRLTVHERKEEEKLLREIMNFYSRINQEIGIFWH